MTDGRPANPRLDWLILAGPVAMANFWFLGRRGLGRWGVVSSDALIMDRKPYTAFCVGTLFEQVPLVRDSFTMLNESSLQLIWFDPTPENRHTVVYRVVRKRSVTSLVSAGQSDSTTEGRRGRPLPDGPDSLQDRN